MKTLALACDVTDAASLAEALRQAAAELPPVRGVLHAAMVLDDRLIANLDAGGMSAVLRPKLLGAWNLHSLTLDLPIEHFVLYSSITTSIGNPGQANYVGGQRRARGPGAAAQAGGTAGDMRRLGAHRGRRVPDPQHGRPRQLGPAPGRRAPRGRRSLGRLDGKLGSDRVDAVANMDWGVLSRFLPSAGGSRFAVLNRRRTDVVKDEAGLDFRALAAEKGVEELTGMVRGLVLQEVAQILSLNVERIDPERPLHDLGMDSLMAVELALGLEKRFGVQFPVMLLNESPSSSRVAGRIVERLTESKESGHDESALVGDIVRRHGEQMSAEDMEHMARNAGAVHGREERA